MRIQGTVGPITSAVSLGQGTKDIDLRLGNMGEAIVSELHARYYEATYRRTVFSAANTAAVATVALTTTASYTGLYLGNNNGNTVNLVLLKASYATSVAVPTAGFVALETGYIASANITVGGAITIANNFIGLGASGQAVAGAGSATLPIAPAARLFLSNANTAATTAGNVAAPQVVDLEGSIILPPGAFIAFATFATNTAAWWFSMAWEEVPI
jgi:hypothetical protein